MKETKITKEYHIIFMQWLKTLRNGNEIDEGKFRKLLVEANRNYVELRASEKESREVEKELGIWTREDEAKFRRLNAKRMKAYRDRKRTRKYSPRPSRLRVK
ncbi:hypothetical protein MUP79_06690 [Candidatus Bathyarchaeota archaeon]|nr:hypothetical protein [Candidatus Bathyarchaeota archaeon]